MKYVTPSSLPSQKKSTTEKTDEWAIETALYYESKIVNENGSFEARRLNRDRNHDLYYHGIMDPIEVAKICNPRNIKDFKLPEDFKNYPITNPKIQTLKGEELKRRFEWKAYVTNRDAVSKKEEAKKEQFMQFIHDQIVAESFSEEEASKKLEGLKEYLNYEWQDIREIAATELLNHYIQYLDLRTVWNRSWEDQLLYAEEIISIDIHNDKPVVERVDPRTVFYITSPEDQHIDDSEAIIREYYLPIGKVIDYYYDYLTENQIKDLEESIRFKAVTNKRFTPNEQYIKSEDGYFIPETNFNPSILNSKTFNGYYDESGNIRIVHTRWKSLRKIGRLFYFDENGDQQNTYVSEQYKIDKDKGETIEWIWVTEAWECTHIGEEIFVKIQPRDIQFRKLDNKSYCSLGYIGTQYSPALFDLMKEYQIKYNAYMHRTEQAMIKALGKIGVLDLAMIPDGWDVDTWMYYATEMGWAIKDSFKEGKKGAALGKLAGGMSGDATVINLEQGQFIQENMNMLNYLDAQLDRIIGINTQRQGQISADAGLGTTQEAIQQSSNITESYFTIHDNIKSRTLQMLLEAAKWCLRNKTESIQYITSDMVSKIFEIDGELINEAEYGLQVGNAMNDSKTIQTLQRAVEQAVQTGVVDLIELMDIFSNESTAAIKRKVQKSVLAKREQEQQRFEQEQELQKQQLEMQRQMHEEQLQAEQADRDLRQYEIDQNNQTKITVSQISNYFKAANTDTDKDGIPDPIEIANQALSEQSQRSKELKDNLDHLIKEKQLEHQKESEKRKRDLEEKKLALQKEKIKSDEKREKLKAETALKVAKQNKNKYDKKK